MTLKHTLLLITLLASSLARASQPEASIDCSSKRGVVPRVSLNVTNSPGGNGGITLIIGSQTYEVDQKGIDTNVAGNVKWTRGNRWFADMYVLDQVKSVHVLLKGVPTSAKVFLENPEQKEESYRFKARLSARIQNISVRGMDVTCQFNSSTGSAN